MITASQVKELREKSGAGMMDCKTALQENEGNPEAAMDWLRTKGIARAEKKSGRIASEGLVGIASSGKKAAIVEVNSETDFVARNEQFQEIVRGIAKTGLEGKGELEEVLAASMILGDKSSQKSVANIITESIGSIGENIGLRRVAVIEVSQGVVASYIHNLASEGLGKIGVLVSLASDGDVSVLEAIGKQIAMHIAALNPLAINRENIPADMIARERAVLLEQAQESGKPENIIEDMVNGRMQKFFQESILLSQPFVVDEDNTVEEALKNAEKDAGASIMLKNFVRFELGEGIEKSKDDFANEVAAMNKS